MTPHHTIEALSAAIDELAEDTFMADTTVDPDIISTAIMLSWLEAKGAAGHTDDEIVSMLHAIADDLASRSFH